MNLQKEKSGEEPAMGVTLIHLKNAYGNVVLSKGYLVENPPQGNGDGKINLTWTIHHLGGFGVVFWLESAGKVIIKDVLITSEHITSISAEGMRIPSLREAKGGIKRQVETQQQRPERAQLGNG